MDIHALALLIASALTVGFGLVRVASWIRDRRDADLIRQIEGEALVAIGHMEMQRIYACEREVFNDSFD
ncbi:hypothetical protein VDG05_19610 [Xanthomonas campestris pv. raphani]|uniref:hypothetical protein n=1 Tax=Xanthomonas campestris TaxID=339 RepID=UPI002B236937|nr:hypothetical protein [Xanthomonas campestris]MEA9886503.1 hypothetical protein [Xanthomonas campestris pv. raphani]